MSHYLNFDSYDFMQTSLIQDGVIRQLEIIGEAAKNLASEVREQNTPGT